MNIHMNLLKFGVCGLGFVVWGSGSERNGQTNIKINLWKFRVSGMVQDLENGVEFREWCRIEGMVSH